MDTLDVYDEVNRLSDILDDKKLTGKEVADLFMYFNNTEKLPSVEKALTKSKNDKVKLTYLRNLLTSGMSQNRKCVCTRQQYRILTYSCAFLSCFLSSNPPKKHIRVIVEQPVSGK